MWLDAGRRVISMPEKTTLWIGCRKKWNASRKIVDFAKVPSTLSIRILTYKLFFSNFTSLDHDVLVPFGIFQSGFFDAFWLDYPQM